MISVILPVYNCANTLGKCIESILSQSFTQYELIIVDDGSTDFSDAIIERYAELDERIVTFSKENGGASSARNLGIDKAKGEYVCFIDSDDYVAPTYLEKLYYCMTKCDTDLALCLISRSTNVEPIGSNVFEDKNDLICSIVNKYEQNAGSCNKMFKRSLMGDLRFAEDIFVGEDTLFCVEYAKRCRNAVRVNQVLYYYEVSTSSMLYVKERLKLRRNLTVIDSRKRMLDDVKMLNLIAVNAICQSMLDYISYNATLGVTYNDITMIKIASRELRLFHNRFSVKLDAWSVLLNVDYVLYYVVRKFYLKGDALLFHIGNIVK